MRNINDGEDLYWDYARFYDFITESEVQTCITFMAVLFN